MRGTRGGNRAHHVHPPGNGSMIVSAVGLVGAYVLAAASSPEAGNITGVIVAVVVGIGAVVMGLQKIGLISTGSVAKAAQERAAAAERELEAKTNEVTLLAIRVRELEGRTDLDPLIESQKQLAEGIRHMAAAVANNTEVVRELSTAAVRTSSRGAIA